MDDQGVARRNRKTLEARGCLFGIVLLIGCCYIWPHTDAYERFNGSTLWRGTHTLQVTGDTTFEWKGGSVTVARIAAMAAKDGYDIELHGPGEYKLLGLSTPQRPREGAFQIVKSRRLLPFESPVYSVLLSQSNNVKDAFDGDSGRVRLVQTGNGFDGWYRAYMTEYRQADSTKRRRIVVQGTFTVR